jgi:triosephosphate isomerase
MGIVVVNFKTYAEATGQRAVRLAKICEKVSKRTGVHVFIAVQNVDLFHVSSEVSIPVFAEHIDPVKYGANTGKDLPEAVVENGASGVLINHSEDRSSHVKIKSDIARAMEVGLTTIACAPTAKESGKIAAMRPDYIAVEPPELIGGDVSVSKAKPGLITETIKFVRKANRTVPVLCGAGIKDHEDVRIAMKLGCEGILVASGVTKAKDPEAALLGLIAGMKKSSSATANLRGVAARHSRASSGVGPYGGTAQSRKVSRRRASRGAATKRKKK